MKDKYTRALHRLTGLQDIVQYIRDKYVITDGAMKEQKICEQAPYGDRFVSQEAWIDILGMISQLEDVEKEFLERHEIRLKDDVIIPNNLKDYYKNEQYKKRRWRRKAGSGGSAPPGSSTAT